VISGPAGWFNPTNGAIGARRTAGRRDGGATGLQARYVCLLGTDCFGGGAEVG
jgi:hypothetical protein